MYLWSREKKPIDVYPQHRKYTIILKRKKTSQLWIYQKWVQDHWKREFNVMKQWNYKNSVVLGPFYSQCE